MATVLSANAMPKHIPGNSPAVKSIALIHDLPSFLALYPPLTYPPTKLVSA